MKKIMTATMVMAICYLMGVMVTNPTICIHTAKDALRLCAEVVVPSLFPFFVCSNLLIALGGADMLSRFLSPLMRPLFGISGGGSLAVVLGVISGYPVGADCAAALYAAGSCSKTEAERMLAFCNNSGPLFVVGAVGVGMFHNPKLGFVLYGVHLCSALLTGMLFRRYGRKEMLEGKVVTEPRTDGTFSAACSAVADGITSILKVCGFVVFFAVLGATIPSGSGMPLLSSFLEITGGIRLLSQSREFGRFLFPLVSMFMAFSGVSVLFQVAGIILPVGLSAKPYLLGKFTQGVIAFLLTGPAMGLTGLASPVFLPTPIPVLPVSPKSILILSLLMIAWCGLFLIILMLAVWLSERKKDRFRASNFWHTNRKRGEEHEGQKTLDSSAIYLPAPDRLQRSR